MNGVVDSSMRNVLNLKFIVLALFVAVGISTAAQLYAQDEPVETATIETSDLSVFPKTVSAGEFVSLHFTVKNTGAATGDYEIPVLVRNSLETLVIGNLSAGASRIHVVRMTRKTDGVFPIQVRGEQVEFLIPPARFSVEHLEASQEIALLGESVIVTANITNVGGVPGDYRSILKINGAGFRTATGFLTFGDSAAHSFDLTHLGAGTHVISLGDQSISVAVLAPPLTFEIVDSIPISSDGTVAKNNYGKQIEFTGENIYLKSKADDVVFVDFPFELSPQEELVTLVDLATGINYSDGFLSLPMPSEGWPTEVFLVLGIDDLETWRNDTVATINSSTLELRDMEVDFSIADPKLASIKWDMDLQLNKIVFGSKLQLSVNKEISQEKRDLFNRLPGITPKLVGEVAFGIEVIDKAVARHLQINGGSLRFDLESSWVDTYVPSAMKIGFRDGYGYGILSPFEVDTQLPNTISYEVLLSEGQTEFSIFSLGPSIDDVTKMIELVGITPQTIVPGDTVEVFGSLMNSEQNRKLVPVTLSVDGQNVQTRLMSLDPNDKKTVSFHVELREPGSYTIGFNSQFGTVQVAAPIDPIDLEIESLEISPPQALINDAVEIIITILNNGSLPGLARPLVWINGVLVRDVPVKLASGEREVLKIDFYPQQIGEYRIAVGGETEVLTVLPVELLADFSIYQLATSLNEVDPGEPFMVSFKLTNEGNAAGVFSGLIEFGDESKEVGPILVDGFTTIPFETELVIHGPGEYLIKFAGEVVGVTVKDSAEVIFDVENLVIHPTETRPGQLISVKAFISNPTEALGVDEIVLKVDEMVVESEWVWLGPGASKQIEYSVTAPESGIHEVDFNGLKAEISSEPMITRIQILVLSVFGIVLVAILGFIGLPWLSRNFQRNREKQN